MSYIVVGLGNPGEEYERTRHNVGRKAVEELARLLHAESLWDTNKKLRAITLRTATTDGKALTLVLPDNYMNRSGGAVAPLMKKPKDIEKLIVVHDDIDLPRLHFGPLHGDASGVGSHVGSPFIRPRQSPLADTRSLPDPLIGGVHERLEFLIRDDPVGYEVSSS